MKVYTKILYTLLYDPLHMPPIMCEAVFMFAGAPGCFSSSRLGLLEFWYLIIDLWAVA
jgi:hypothetical protein